MFKVPEKFRIKNGVFGSTSQAGNNGAFNIFLMKSPDLNPLLHNFHAIASDQMDWEHVSISMEKRCPTWEEMCFIKDMFWDEEDLVVQMHVPKKDYVNNHPFCLHLWRKAGTNDFCETPPKIFV